MKKDTHICAISDFNSIVASDLWEEDVLHFENGLILKYIGNTDIRTNDEHLFKTLYSPFATVCWIEKTAKEVSKFEVKLIRR